MLMEDLLLCCCVCVIHVKKTLIKNNSKMPEDVHGISFLYCIYKHFRLHIYIMYCVACHIIVHVIGVIKLTQSKNLL